MGVNQSPAYLSLCLQDLTKDISDQHLHLQKKNRKINLYPARRGLRPSWGEMEEAEDWLHYTKHLTQRQALAMAHFHFDPLMSAPQVHTLLKFMY